MTESDEEIRTAFVAEVERIPAKRSHTKVGQAKSDLLVYPRGVTATVGQVASSNNRIFSANYEPNDQRSRWLGGPGYQGSTTRTSARFLVTEPSAEKIVWQGNARITLDDRH
ncbi:hypothetical protein [Haloferula sp.]|uniref:hypothetical protein n=1 Tax=Haloferula sp. TaxID=2497595 RepID=UPI003C728F8E